MAQKRSSSSRISIAKNAKAAESRQRSLFELLPSLAPPKAEPSVSQPTVTTATPSEEVEAVNTQKSAVNGPNSKLRIRGRPSNTQASNSASRTLYSIFSKKPGPSTDEDSTLVDDIISVEVNESLKHPNVVVGTKQTNPIVIIDSSPSRPTPTPEPTFFITPSPSRFSSVPPPVSPQKSRSKNTNHLPVFPDSEFQHVKGHQTVFRASSSTVPLRRRNARTYDSVPTSLSLSFLVPDLHSSDGASTPASIKEDLDGDWRQHVLDSIPDEHKSHAAIDRILRTPVESSYNPQEDWVHRWRPIKADEVLGNEGEARYLRDWLHALKVKEQTPEVPVEEPSQLKKKRKKGRAVKDDEKRRVIRAVAKSHKRRRIDSDEEDGWIVDDDDNVSYWSDEDEEGQDTLPMYLQSPSKAERRKDICGEYSFDNWLTNTILLHGPPGCGKTAAVYACAAELGWEVFEVYPGIGKRSGANVDNLVGDVGKNHLVHAHHHHYTHGPVKAQKQKQDSNAFARLFGKAANLETPPPAEGGANAGVRQSLLLLEEADILFQDDVNFWPAVINLIKECRRPVILTCNDVSLIPQNGLALQTILTFKSCATALAASFLQSVLLADGQWSDRDEVSRVYETEYRLNPVDIPDVPLHPLTEGLAVPDLRRSINALQMWGSSSSGGDVACHAAGFYDVPSSAQALSGSAHLLPRERWGSRLATECMSYMDSFVVRKAEVSSWGHTLNSWDAAMQMDDEVGHAVLRDPVCGAEYGGVGGFYDEDVEMANYCVAVASGGTRAGSVGDECEMFRDRGRYQAAMLEVLGEILVPSGALMPRGAVFTDYVGWLRTIVAGDDAEAGRRTRRGTVYSRPASIAVGRVSVLGQS